MRILILIAFLLLGAGCKEPASNLGAELINEQMDELVIRIEAEQAEDLKNNGKYEYIARTLDEKTGLEFERQEYKTPNGSLGYQILIYDEQGRIKKSIDSGLEPHRNYEKTYSSTTST